MAIKATTFYLISKGFYLVKDKKLFHKLSRADMKTQGRHQQNVNIKNNVLFKSKEKRNVTDSGLYLCKPKCGKVEGRKRLWKQWSVAPTQHWHLVLMAETTAVVWPEIAWEPYEWLSPFNPLNAGIPCMCHQHWGYWWPGAKHQPISILSANWRYCPGLVLYKNSTFTASNLRN